MKNLFNNKIILLSNIVIIFLSIYCIVASSIPLPFWVSSIVCCIVFIVYVIIVSRPNKKVGERIAIVDNTKTYKHILNRLYELSSMCKNDKYKNDIDSIIEEFKYADPVSNCEMHDVEDEIISCLDTTKTAIETNDFMEVEKDIFNLKSKILLRNHYCKDNK